MNFRHTYLFFASMLGVLWLFGLIVSYKKTVVDEAFLVPSLNLPDTKITELVFQRTDEKGKPLPDLVFKQADDAWTLHEDGQKVRVEGFRLNGFVNSVKEARRNDEADVSGSLAHYGLSPPKLVVVLKGKQRDLDKEWKFNLGKESADKTLVYANSSDRSDKPLAVSKQQVEGLLFKDTSELRARRLFDFTDSQVVELLVSKGAQKLHLKRNDSNLWVFESPALGFAGFDGGDDDKKQDKLEAPKETGANSVKALLKAAAGMVVAEENDFVSLGTPLARYGVEDGNKDALRIEIGIPGAKNKKEITKEVLIVGKRVPNKDQYYARLSSDDGVMQVSTKLIDPILKALDDPGRIRSMDVAAFDAKEVDAIVLKHGKDEIKLLRSEVKIDWQIYAGAEKPRKASEKQIAALLDLALGKKAILEFHDVKEADLKAKEAEWGLAPPVSEISIYVKAIEKEKEAKDDKDGKDKAKDDKKDKDKKDPAPTLKKDAKAVVSLALGKIDKDAVPTRRTLLDGSVTRFRMAKALAELLSPPEGITLSLLDPAVPGATLEEITSFTLTRGAEKIEAERVMGDRSVGWKIKNPQDPTGYSLAETGKTMSFLNAIATMQAKKWLEKLDARSELAKMGLATPDITIALTMKKERVPPAAVASALAQLGGASTGLVGAAAFVANKHADAGETVTIKLGKESDSDKAAVFAQHSGVDTLFLVPLDLVKAVREIDLRDRTLVGHFQGLLDAAQVANVAAQPMSALALLTPLVSGTVHQMDPSQVKLLKIETRTPLELRTLVFTGSVKDKTWSDKSDLKEFQYDSSKVSKVSREVCNLVADRLVSLAGGPRDEHKLGAKDWLARIEIATEDGKAATLTIGASFEKLGHFAHSTAWPDAVFLVPATFVEPLLRGPAHFGKERVASAP